MDNCQKTLQCWLPCKPDMAVTTVTGSGWGDKLVRLGYFRVTKRGHRKSEKKEQESQNQPYFLTEALDERLCSNGNLFKSTGEFIWEKKFSSSPGSPNWPLEATLQVWEGKDERPININLPLRPPFQASKYLIVLGQLCCFVGRASVDPFYKTTPVPPQWRPCPVAPHCPRNGRLQRIQDFFHHRQLEADRVGSLCLIREGHKSWASAGNLRTPYRRLNLSGQRNCFISMATPYLKPQTESPVCPKLYSSETQATEASVSAASLF